MTLITFAKHFEHFEGKQYFLAMIRDNAGGQRGTYVVKNWGKSVDYHYTYGQVQIEFFSDHNDAVTAYNREEHHREGRGYTGRLIYTWDALSATAQAGLQNKAPHFDPGLLSGMGGAGQAVTYSNGVTIQYDENGNSVPSASTDSYGNPLAAKPAKKEVDPDAIPGPRTGGAKRLEWVMAHSDHPAAMDQMMQVAQQMTSEREKAATTVAAIDNDLAFVNAWLQQNLAAMVR